MSLSRVCHPPDSFATGPSRYAPFNSNCPATSPHRQSGCPLSRIRYSRAVSPGLERVVLAQVAEAQSSGGG